MDAIVGQNIRFTNTSDLKGKPVLWFEWDFGDGTTDNTSWNAMHSYSAVGTYTAQLIVQTECGTCTPCAETIYVTVPVVITCETGGCDLLLSCDTDNDGAISQLEYNDAINDPTLTFEQKQFIQVGDINTQCPGCYQASVINCNGGSPTFGTGCKLLLHFDVDGDGIISQSEATAASNDQSITNEEAQYVINMYNSGGVINNKCPGCYTKEPTPYGIDPLYIMVAAAIAGALIMTQG